jgi:hypothetical protein
MVSNKARSIIIATGLALFVTGAAIAISSRPVFTFMRNEVEEIPKSETIMNYTFDIHQSQDKLVEFQMSIGQKLDVLATGSADFNFSISNFTDPTQISQPDHPDIVYLSMDNISAINTTWSPVVRLPQPGSYYLIFLARNASIDSPVEIEADVTKTWTEVEPYQVPYQKALIKSDFVYLGLGILIPGGAISVVTFISKPRPRRRASKEEKRARKSQFSCDLTGFLRARIYSDISLESKKTAFAAFARLVNFFSYSVHTFFLGYSALIFAYNKDP